MPSGLFIQMLSQLMNVLEPSEKPLGKAMVTLQTSMILMEARMFLHRGDVLSRLAGHTGGAELQPGTELCHHTITQKARLQCDGSISLNLCGVGKPVF